MAAGVLAQLIPLNPVKLQVHDLKETDECVTIGRNENCDLVLPDQRCSSNHCRLWITREEGKVIFEVEDLSTNGTYVNNGMLGKGNKMKLQHGDELIMLHEKKVGGDDMLGFKLTLPTASLKRKREEDVEQPEKKAKVEAPDISDATELKCGICTHIIHQPADELLELDRKNKITNDDFKVTRRKPKKKSGFESDGSASSVGEAKQTVQYWQGPAQCRQCKAEKDGYRCVFKQEHVVCNTCNTRMPKRPNIPQQCQVCKKYFCNLTYRSLKHCDNGVETLKARMAKWTTVPPGALSGNLYEQNVLKDFIRGQGDTVPQFYVKAVQKLAESDWEVTVGGNKVKPRQEWPLCKDCSEGFQGELIFIYRESVHEQFPAFVKARPRCWFGRECTTQKHNAQHAQKYNHIGANTKKK